MYLKGKHREEDSLPNLGNFYSFRRMRKRSASEAQERISLYKDVHFSIAAFPESRVSRNRRARSNNQYQMQVAGLRPGEEKQLHGFQSSLTCSQDTCRAHLIV